MISVVIPVYKPNPVFLEETLTSVTSQKQEGVEIIVSVDGTLTPKIENIINLHAQVIDYNTNPPGIFSNLNNGISKASNPFVQILCQDDRLVPLSLSKIHKAIASSDAGFIYSQMSEINEHGQTTGFRPGPISKDFIVHSSDLALRLFLKHGCLPGNLSTVCFKKEIFDSVGGFRTDLQYCGDFELWVRMVQNGASMGILFPNLIDVRTHENRASYTLGHGIWAREVIQVYDSIFHSISPKKEIHKQNYHAKVFRTAITRIRKEKSLEIVKHIKELVYFHWNYAFLTFFKTMGFLRLKLDSIRLQSNEE